MNILKSAGRTPATATQLKFKPLPDITTYELARCMSVMLDTPHLVPVEMVHRLEAEGESVKRHWHLS